MKFDFKDREVPSKRKCISSNKLSIQTINEILEAVHVEKLSYTEVRDKFNITIAVIGNLVKDKKEGNSKVNKLAVRHLN